MYHSLIIAVAIILLTACEPYEPPDANGPGGSWWVGGVDGGVYVFIEDDDNPADNIYQGSIYFDSDKTLWYRGKFQYSENTAIDVNNRDIYSGWDGARLYLKDNSYLTAMGEIPAL